MEKKMANKRTKDTNGTHTHTQRQNTIRRKQNPFENYENLSSLPSFDDDYDDDEKENDGKAFEKKTKTKTTTTTTTTIDVRILWPRCW